MTDKTDLYSDIKFLEEKVYNKCGFILTNLQLNMESAEYGACSFEINQSKVEHRISKITPSKIGQFVTIWKRNNNGKTEPFDFSDPIDFVVITSRNVDKIGQFIFPKSVLVDKGIIAQNGSGGKRGIRVYPPWDITTNSQAEKTQRWQTKYFLSLENDSPIDHNLTKKLFKNNK